MPGFHGAAKLKIDESDAQRFALEVVHKLRDAGFESLWAGGCVRDRLLGKTPKDYDIATNANPQQVREVFGRRRTIAVGASFGVITVLGRKSEGQIEVATFRQDAGYSDGRHPDAVRFSTAEKDAQRRDFTINGLFYDPIDERVIDYVEGERDLKRKVIRAIGNPQERIAEDKLRMLRAVRFAANYEFELDGPTLLAIQENAGSIRVVSRERILAELRRIFGHANRRLGVTYLQDARLLNEIFDHAELPDLSGVPRSMELVGAVASERFETAIALFLLPLTACGENGAQGTRQFSSVLREWKFSNEEARLILWLLGQHPVLLNASPETWPAVQRILVQEQAQEMLFFCDAVSQVARDTYRDQLAYCRKQMLLPPDQFNPPPLLNGDDLKQAGYSPGPGFRTVLDRVRDLQLMGQLNQQEQALQLARQWLDNP